MPLWNSANVSKGSPFPLPTRIPILKNPPPQILPLRCQTVLATTRFSCGFANVCKAHPICANLSRQIAALGPYFAMESGTSLLAVVVLETPAAVEIEPGAGYASLGPAPTPPLTRGDGGA